MKEDEIVAEIEAEVKGFPENRGMIIVTVGNEATPASIEDMERAADTVNEVLGDVEGIRALIVPHLVQVEMIPIKSFLALGED